MSKNLCKASDKRLAHDAEKVAERQAEGKAIYRCERCERLSHKEDHLCKPDKIKPAKPKKVAVVEVSPAEAPAEIPASTGE